MKFANGICLITENVRKLAEFYEKVLQVKVDDVNDIHVEITIDGGGITIYSKAAAIRDMGFNFDEYCGTGMCKFAFFVEDVDAEYERLKSLNINIKFVAAPTTYPWGSRAMHFRDPDGNIICFIELSKYKHNAVRYIVARCPQLLRNRR